MPTITEAHVVMLKNQKNYLSGQESDLIDDTPTPWEQFLTKDRKTAPQRYQVHLIVSGFSAREDARGFAENFMSYGSIFVFNNEKRPLYRLEVEPESHKEEM